MCGKIYLTMWGINVTKRKKLSLMTLKTTGYWEENQLGFTKEFKKVTKHKNQ